MNKTTHYQLNQWDPEDRIMRADFNADNAALEEALYENAQAAAEARQTALDAVAAEETARKDAVSSEAETRSSQDAAIRAELSTAVAEAKNEAASANAAVQSQLSTLTGQTRKTLLKECTIPEDTLQYDVDVSWIDWSEWNTVIIDAYMQSTLNATEFYFKPNGTQVCTLGGGGGLATSPEAKGVSRVILCPFGEAGNCFSGILLGNAAAVFTSSFLFQNVTYIQLESHSSCKIKAGSHLRFWGVRV